MIRLRIFKKFLIPCTVACMHDGEKEPVCDAEGKRLIRPSDLPIYGDECYVCDGKPCDDPCALEAQIGHLRKELWVWVDKYNGYRSKVFEVCATGKVHAETMLESLREESNFMPRAGAIGLGGLAGVVFGLRGGIIRKVTYGAVGAGAVAAVCYPREASEYTEEGLHFMKKYVQIAYNFIYGVKPDYLRLPEPSTFMTGADVPKHSPPADVSKHSPPADASKLSSPADARVLGQSPGGDKMADGETPPEKARTSRDQSRAEDKILYTTRSK